MCTNIYVYSLQLNELNYTQYPYRIIYTTIPHNYNIYITIIIEEAIVTEFYFIIVVSCFFIEHTILVSLALFVLDG